ncbi:unnamed protein product, partial [Choristocarpus tenellus]
MRGQETSGVKTVAVGLSSETPGAIYQPKLDSVMKAPVTFRILQQDRFPKGHNSFTNGNEVPGPGAYNVNSTEWAKRARAMAWNGCQTYFESEWARPTPPLLLRPWCGFGYGCSVNEHITYGACLDMLCCKRHPIEQKNALQVTQFLKPRQAPRMTPAMTPCPEQVNKPLTLTDANGGVSMEESVVHPASASTTAGTLLGTENKRSARGPPALEGLKQTPLHFACEYGDLGLVDR